MKTSQSINHIKEEHKQISMHSLADINRTEVEGCQKKN